ncbi:hypothetical protein [Rodentibacter caecimuris]|uniref:hypothetical protein n=1 Tax=Rodentibacter caecimuris TaxID=1796644 RepID=UPI002119C1A9|nr:hypothetical protein [Rodentibacter heylii]MCQ9124721.1 hypothetical protein [Rodentibacter heylii]
MKIWKTTIWNIPYWLGLSLILILISASFIASKLFSKNDSIEKLNSDNQTCGKIILCFVGGIEEDNNTFKKPCVKELQSFYLMGFDIHQKYSALSISDIEDIIKNNRDKIFENSKLRREFIKSCRKFLPETKKKYHNH